MKQNLELYDIYPKVVPSYEMSTITIKALDYSVAFDSNKIYTIVILPLKESIEGEKDKNYESFLLKPSHNQFVFSYFFQKEQQYFIRLLDEEGNRVEQLSVYALDEDLYSRKPYKGDLHVHTCFSDGKESPEFVVAKYRESGFDFLAITDHHRYKPSMRAIEKYQDVNLGIKLFPGEEVHGLDNHIHIVNFGGDYSINEVFQNNAEKYYEEVREIEKRLECPAHVDRFTYASCLWIYDHIRKANGLGIFAHPHWLANVYHVRDEMSAYQFKEQAFDAFELIGGQSVIENNMQLAFYHEMRKQLGKDIPIVGSSDSHGVLGGKLFDEMKTIVLAQSNQKNDIIQAVKENYSTAIESYKGEHYKVHGNYRMVSYVLFLLEEYFPLHDALCYEEGRAMLAYIRGEASAKELLGLLKTRTEKLIRKYFGRYKG